MKEFRRNKRALSPVIATVILVSVTIVVAVSVAYWLGTIAASYTAFEQIEMPTPYAEYNSSLFKEEVAISESVSLDVSGAPSYAGALANSPILPGSLTLTVQDDASPPSTYDITDDGLGVLVSDDLTLDPDPLNPSTIDYATGAFSFSLDPLAPPTLVADASADYTGTKGGWNVYIELKNTGSADATIDNIFLNEKPLNDYPIDNIKLFVSVDTGLPEDLSDISIPVTKGSSEKVIVWIQRGTEGCSSGTRIDLKLHSAGGYNYPAQVKLI